MVLFKTVEILELLERIVKDKITVVLVYVISDGLDENGKGKDTRTKEQKESLLNLIDELLIAYDLDIDDVYCHYQFAKKLCPCFSIENFKEEYLNFKS